MTRFDEFLIDLEREALAHVLSEMVARHPELQPEAEAFCAAAAAAYARGKTHPPIDLALVQTSLRSILRQGSSRYYGGVSGSAVVGALHPWLERAQKSLAAGQGLAALEILAVVTDELVEVGNAVYDEEGELYECMLEVGQEIARALLLAELTADERRAWYDRIEAWSAALGDYFEIEVFRPALLAARHGWDYPPLIAILRGEADEGAGYGERTGGVVPALGPVMLDVLEQQERWEELLRLATTLGAAERCVDTLLRLGRPEEAFAWIHQHPPTAAVLHALVQTLARADHLASALELADRHLATAKSFTFDSLALVRWVRDEAGALGDHDRAIAAARQASAHSLTLEDYRAARKAAGAGWPELRRDLLERVWNEKRSFRFQATEILLEEGLLDQAVAAVDASSNRDALERVVEAVIPTHPDWVFSTCRREFDKLVDRPRSNDYPKAAQWLAWARQSQLLAAREAEWQAYLEQMIQDHFRKRSLRPLLEALR